VLHSGRATHTHRTASIQVVAYLTPVKALRPASRHVPASVGGSILASNITRRADFALFMVEAFQNDELVHEAPRDRRPPDTLGARPWRQRMNRSVGETHEASVIAACPRPVSSGSRLRRARLTAAPAVGNVAPSARTCSQSSPRALVLRHR
jgi:hypothetical protein